jgi:Fe-S-cluster containining protein
MQDVPECLACGACCFSMLESYVRVFGDDHTRLAARAEELVWFDGNRAYMRMVDGHCGALRIEAASGQLVCSAYATRPQICRDLSRGGGACRGELEAKAPRPLLALGLSAREPVTPTAH